MESINVTVTGPKNSNGTYKNIILKDGVSLVDQLNEAYAIYHVKWDYDLNGESIIMPENSVLKMEGGSISNGTLISTNTVLYYDTPKNKTFINITFEGEWDDMDLGLREQIDELQEKDVEHDDRITELERISGDREASSEIISNMGRVIIKPNIKKMSYWALYPFEQYHTKLLVNINTDGSIWIPYEEYGMNVLVPDGEDEFMELELVDIRDIEEISDKYIQFNFAEDTISLPDGEEVKISDLGEAMYKGDITDYEEGKIVEKNILTQLMINEPNTIYVIQYNFDLDGSTITIPENCILQFDGGSLSNGTLAGHILIEGNCEKVFKNITFANTILNDVLEVKWFSFADNADALNTLQNLVDYTKSTIQLEREKEYLISHKIVITKPVVFDGNGATIKLTYNYNKYSTDYVIQVNNTLNVTIKNLTILSTITYIERPSSNEDLSYEYWQNRSTGKYNCYGINIYFSNGVKIDNCTIHHCGIGILCQASHDYIISNNYVHHTLLDAIANYQGCYNGTICKNITDYTDDDGISVVTYTNFEDERGRQCYNFTITENTISNSFSRGIGVIGCDVATVKNNTIENCSLGAIKAAVEQARDGKSSNILIQGNYINNGNYLGVYVRSTNNAIVCGNSIQTNADISGIYIQRGSCTTLTGNVLNGCRLYFEDTQVLNVCENILVNAKVFSGSTQNVDYPHEYHTFKSNIFDNEFATNSKYIKLYNTANIEFTNNIIPEVAGIVSFANSTKVKVDAKTLNIIVENEATNLEIIDNTLTFSGGYYDNIAGGTVIYNEEYRFVRIFDKTANTLRYIPYIASGNSPVSALGNAYVQGMSYYDTAYNHIAWWNGTKWVDANGFTIGKLFGTTNNRPSNLTQDDKGFCYFDTTLNKPVYWDGTTWVDAIGSTV